MKAWHRELAHIAAYSPGINVTEIAQKMGKARGTVSRALHSEPVQELIAQLAAEKETQIAQVGTERLNELVPKSYDVLGQVLDDPEAPASAKVTAALSVLKGAGHLVEKTQHDHKGLFGVIVVDPE